jgi:hypothetical protein
MDIWVAKRRIILVAFLQKVTHFSIVRCHLHPLQRPDYKAYSKTTKQLHQRFGRAGITPEPNVGSLKNKASDYYGSSLNKAMPPN